MTEGSGGLAYSPLLARACLTAQGLMFGRRGIEGEDDFIIFGDLRKDRPEACEELRNVFFLLVDWNDDGNLHCFVGGGWLDAHK